MVPFRFTIPWFSVLTVFFVGACSDENYPQDEWMKRHPVLSSASASPSSSSEPPPEVDRGPTCLPVRTAEALPARLVATSSAAPATQQTIFIADLFSLFKTNCGRCHVDGSSGDLHVASINDFPEKVDESVVASILSDDPKKSMPPLENGGKLASQRTAGDPVLELANLLKAWIAAGSPRDVFYPAADNSAATASFILTNDAGDHFTNLGSCIPAKKIVATEIKKSEELDAMFAALSASPPGQGTPAQRLGLPEHLEETDIFTFDTETLARHGVVSFAPAYPLWSDNAGKLRQVRVPRGKSIRFDKATQTFDIPDNTRFYKTFFRKIIDVDGVISFKKVETRLIVARHDVDSGETHEIKALYGTYLWNEDETKATLLVDALGNGEPFRDRLLTVITDEPGAAEVRKTKWKDLTAKYEQAGVIRRYAVPGKERCRQCHMGSATKSFVLGFLPMQIKRVQQGASGTIEPAGPDELNQLQRLIDYGIITGMDSPNDVDPLEVSQAPRKPRNDYELKAQGYMLGNCSHCHNPRGFPTISAPVLAGVLDFLPSHDGGIFDFSLEKSSPRIFRGLSGDVPIHYITPSLMDIEPTGDSDTKWGIGDVEAADKSAKPAMIYNLLAPWRSLIFRNVDTPFAYAGDNAIFPHMPMNVPGFDCRAPKILGDWMVSIPSRWKNPATLEFAIRGPLGDIDANHPVSFYNFPPYAGVDSSPQPYEEIKAGDADYQDAVAEAKHRLDLFHSGRMDSPAPETYGRYDFCPDTSDIVDPTVLKDPLHHPVPTDDVIPDPNDPNGHLMPRDGEPNRPHWVITDLTETGGDWTPRRPDWRDILVDRKFSELTIKDFASLNDLQTAKEKQARDKGLVGLLQNVTLDSKIREAASRTLPYGFWQRKDGCDLSSQHTVGWYKKQQAVADLPGWMRNAADDAVVYEQHPGEAIYNMICINCHGTNFDSLGRQADNLVLMTGGNARVANFRHGLFGLESSPGSNRSRVFGGAVPGVTEDDMGARYMAWMALGGTAQTIPPSLLGIVANTDVLGIRRKWQAHITSANMLDSAKALCASLLELGNPTFDFLPDSPNQAGNLVPNTGDADLWPWLCAINNPIPLRAVYPRFNGDTFEGLKMRPPFDFYPNLSDRPADSRAYPASARVGDETGHVVTGLTAANKAPWCVRLPKNAAHKVTLDAYLNQDGSKRFGELMPYCPANVVPPSDDYPDATDGHIGSAAANGDPNDLSTLWATRGAVNAGLSVFLFIDDITHQRAVLTPRFDRCDLLSSAKH